MSSSPLPSDLGLNPDLFPSFREGQLELATSLPLTPARFPLLNAPCGTGKSIDYYTAALLYDLRLLILTPQKALQDQLMHDFGPDAEGDLADVRGQSNYTCPHYRNCEIGAANECPLRRSLARVEGGRPVEGGVSGQCPNIAAIDHARKSRHVVTNNAFWMTQGRAKSFDNPPPGIGQFDLLVIDEGHQAPDKLADFCTITVIEPEVEALLDCTLPTARSSLGVWSDWARVIYPRIPALAKTCDNPRERMRLRSIERDLVELAGVATDSTTTWIYRRLVPERKHTFTPVWASAYAERYLFQSTPKVLLTSATLLPNIGEYLGIGECESEYIDVATTFPVANRPFIYVPTGVALGYRSTPTDIRVIMSTYDRIIDRWAGAGYNGLFHTQSNDLTEKFLACTRNRARMLTYESGGASEVIDYLKRHPRSGKLAVGPSLKEGFDLKYGAAEYQIIGKMPINNTSDPVQKARAQSNPHYMMDQTATQLLQMKGRIERAMDDIGYSYTGDERFGWVKKEARLPRSFRESIVWCNNGVVPDPPPIPPERMLQLIDQE